MILLKASFWTEPAQRDAVLDALAELRAIALAMDGCRGFEVLTEPNNPSVLTIVEEWRDAASLEVHEASTSVEDFKTRTVEMIQQLGPTRVFEVARETGLVGSSSWYVEQGYVRGE